MKTYIIVSIILFILPSILKGQNQNLIETENILELAIYKPDSTALRNRIRSVKLYYKEKQGIERLIQQEEFDRKGKINRIIEYSYSSPNNSHEIKVLSNTDKDFDVETKVSQASYASYFRNQQSQLLFPWPDYKDIIDFGPQNNIYTVRKSYEIFNDSMIKVATFFNKKMINEKSFINPFFVYNENVEVPRYDSTHSKDSVILTSLQKDENGQNVITKKYFLNNKIVKEELKVYDNDTLGRYNISRWQYEKNGGRLISVEEGMQSNNLFTKIFVKKITYNKNGNRIETEDKNSADGRIDVLSEYDKKNNLVKWIKYQYSYDNRLVKLQTVTNEFRREFDLKGLLVSESFYFNGIFQNIKRYSYDFFN